MAEASRLSEIERKGATPSTVPADRSSSSTTPLSLHLSLNSSSPRMHRLTEVPALMLQMLSCNQLHVAVPSPSTPSILPKVQGLCTTSTRTACLASIRLPYPVTVQRLTPPSIRSIRTKQPYANLALRPYTPPAAATHFHAAAHLSQPSNTAGVDLSAGGQAAAKESKAVGRGGKHHTAINTHTATVGGG